MLLHPSPSFSPPPERERVRPIHSDELTQCWGQKSHHARRGDCRVWLDWRALGSHLHGLKATQWLKQNRPRRVGHPPESKETFNFQPWLVTSYGHWGRGELSGTHSYPGWSQSWPSSSPRSLLWESPLSYSYSPGFWRGYSRLQWPQQLPKSLRVAFPSSIL